MHVFLGDNEVSSVAKVHYIMFINIVNLLFDALSMDLAPESSSFHSLYKVGGSVFSNVAKCWFTSGFLDLLQWPCGTPARCRQLPQLGARLESKGGGDFTTHWSVHYFFSRWGNESATPPRAEAL